MRRVPGHRKETPGREWPAAGPLIRMLVTASLVGALNLSGCTDAPGPGSVTRTDSAGVTIVTSPGQERPLALRKQLSIGVVEGEEPYQLFRVVKVLVDPHGVIYVASGGTATIRVFGPDGRFVREFGGRGSGPGEFDPLWTAWLVDDTLAVLGRTGRVRVSLFSTVGDYLGAWEPIDPVDGYAVPVGGGNGVWIGRESLPFRPESGYVEVRDTLRFHRLDPADGSRVELIAALPGPRRFSPSVAGALFDARPTGAADGRGRLHYSHGAEYRIDTYDAEGLLVRSIRRRDEPRPIEQRWIDEYLAAVDSFYRSRPDRPGKSEQIERVGRRRVDGIIATHVPPLGRLLAGPDGALWVERPDRVDDYAAVELEMVLGRVRGEPRVSTWDVFDPDGVYIGTATLPARFTPHHGTAASVAGVERDELDVERVVRYLVEPAGE